jgi:hypothetical protein
MNRGYARQAVAFVVALAGVALSPVPPAAAAATTTTQTQAPVSFTITPSQCPQVRSTVTGTGEHLTITNTRTDQDGTTHVVVNDLVTGTATDTAGGSYRFVYHNHSTATMAPGAPVQMLMNDSFILNGSGSASGIHVGFVFRLTFAAPGQPPTIEPVNIRGNPVDPVTFEVACDPI